MHHKGPCILIWGSSKKNGQVFIFLNKPFLAGEKSWYSGVQCSATIPSRGSGDTLHCGANCPGSEKLRLATPNHHSRLIFETPIEISICYGTYGSLFGQAGGFTSCALQQVVVNQTKRCILDICLWYDLGGIPIGRQHRASPDPIKITLNQYTRKT